MVGSLWLEPFAEKVGYKSTAKKDIDAFVVFFYCIGFYYLVVTFRPITWLTHDTIVTPMFFVLK